VSGALELFSVMLTTPPSVIGWFRNCGARLISADQLRAAASGQKNGEASRAWLSVVGCPSRLPE
jgi:hypothetical protein